MYVCGIVEHTRNQSNPAITIKRKRSMLLLLFTRKIVVCFVALDYGPNSLQPEEDLSETLLVDLCRETYVNMADPDSTASQTSVE